jgi:hypothetical protein
VIADGEKPVVIPHRAWRVPEPWKYEGTPAPAMAAKVYERMIDSAFEDLRKKTLATLFRP